jgi:hypothetical protein
MLENIETMTDHKLSSPGKHGRWLHQSVTSLLAKNNNTFNSKVDFVIFDQRGN